MNRLATLAASLALSAALAAAAGAQTTDGERKVRDVTPKNIPVIILPPRKDGKINPPSSIEPIIPGVPMVAAVTDDGTVSTEGKIIQLVGIAQLSTNQLCEASNGGRWPCGLRGYIALRNLIHGKEIRCEVVASTAGADQSRCFRERSNISEWMLAEGWALYDESANNEVLSRLAQDAQKNARGIWSNGSRPLKQTSEPVSR